MRIFLLSNLMKKYTSQWVLSKKSSKNCPNSFVAFHNSLFKIQDPEELTFEDLNTKNAFWPILLIYVITIRLEA